MTYAGVLRIHTRVEGTTRKVSSQRNFQESHKQPVIFIFLHPLSIAQLKFSVDLGCIPSGYST